MWLFVPQAVTAMKRRTYLGAAAAAVLAGCSSSEEANEATPGDESESDDGGSDGDNAEPETFDDFEELDQWTAEIGTLTADEERSATGTQSARLEAGDGDDQIRLVQELSEPRDFSGVRPSLAISTEEEADVVIQLIDEDGDRIDFRQRMHAGTPLAQCNFGVSSLEGEPDLSAVAEIQLIRWTGEDDKGSVWIDDLRFADAPEPGQVMLQFDGGYESDYTHALPVLEEYDYPAVSFLTTERIREDESAQGDHLIRDQVGELADAGWTIGSYSARGLNLVDPSDDRDPEAEISDAVDWLEDEGFEDGAQYFSYPLDRYDGDVLDLVADHHEVAFAGRYPSHGEPANPHLCPRVSSPSASQARTALDLTAELGGITAISFGELDNGSRSVLEETVAHLDELESAGDLEVILPEDIHA